MMRCFRCNAECSAWETRTGEALGVFPCWCDGVPLGVSHSIANIAYAELCHIGLRQPVRIHDIVRFVAQKYAGTFQNSIKVVLSQDKRFCWGGRSLYGLVRHGLVPGARTLAEAAYAILLASPRELHIEEVDFVLERFNYRFNSDSLVHHLRGYTGNRWNLRFQTDNWNRVSVNIGRDARHDYNAKVGAFPTHAAFDRWVEHELAPKVARTLDDRARRLAGLKGGKAAMPRDRIEFQ